MALLPYPHLTILALSFLDVEDLCKVQRVSKFLRDLVGGDFGLWKGLIARDFGNAKVRLEAGQLNDRSPFLKQYKELTIPQFNGLAVKFTCTRVKGKMEGDIFSGLPILEVVSELHLTTTLINQADTALRVNSYYSLMAAVSYRVQHGNKSLHPRQISATRRDVPHDGYRLSIGASIQCSVLAYLVLMDLDKATGSSKYFYLTKDNFFVKPEERHLREDNKPKYMLFFSGKGESISYTSYCIYFGDDMNALKEMRISAYIKSQFNYWDNDAEGKRMWDGKLISRGLQLID